MSIFCGSYEVALFGFAKHKIQAVIFDMPAQLRINPHICIMVQKLCLPHQNILDRGWGCFVSFHETNFPNRASASLRGINCPTDNTNCVVESYWSADLHLDINDSYESKNYCQDLDTEPKIITTFRIHVYVQLATTIWSMFNMWRQQVFLSLHESERNWNWLISYYSNTPG